MAYGGIPNSQTRGTVRVAKGAASTHKAVAMGIKVSKVGLG